MSKFKKDNNKDTPGISTASLPDIVFMLLFFFMVTTVMRETTIMVKQSLPQASEIQKLEKKSLVSYIYIGSPLKSYSVQHTNPFLTTIIYQHETTASWSSHHASLDWELNC